MFKTLPPEPVMRRAVMDRDAAFDGVFYACVTTTRIFCRPSCTARKPSAGNVRFRASVRDCLLDGYRPCKRCRPLAISPDDSTWLEPILRHVEHDPGERITDADLRTLGVSPHRARRYFIRNFGMTFQAYHRARRMGLAMEQLRTGGDELGVAYAHGYDSASGFRDAFAKIFGTTPGRTNGLAVIKTARIETPLGPMVAGAIDEGVCFLEFADRRAFARQADVLRRKLHAVMTPGRHEWLDQLESELDEYFDSARKVFSVPLACHGSTFQTDVWSALQKIPFGETRSYEDIARAIGHASACRAVGRANGENRVAIVIPCHRVIGADGRLTGYGGGLWRKKWLLDHEKRIAANGKPLNSRVELVPR
jgi:AraC family transcriptional regulator of adaptative response/methylated-DNA-[protein]-cysteine methyltransferase